MSLIVHRSYQSNGQTCRCAVQHSRHSGRSDNTANVCRCRKRAHVKIRYPIFLFPPLETRSVICCTCIFTGSTAEHMSKIAWKNHKHSVNNPLVIDQPSEISTCMVCTVTHTLLSLSLSLSLSLRNSQFQKEYTLDEIKNSRMVHEPLTMLQCWYVQYIHTPQMPNVLYEGPYVKTCMQTETVCTWHAFS